MKYLAVLFLFMSCKGRKQKDLPVEIYIQSNNPDSLVIGYNHFSVKDSAYIYKIFENPFDERVSFSRDFYGQSVYEAKMNALRRLSTLPPPRAITSEPDTAVIMFYKVWFEQREN